MVARSSSCRECGYQPIGPYTDNCPICAASVRFEDDEGCSATGHPEGLARQRFPAATIVGWVVIACVSFWLYGQQIPWLLLMGGPAALAWWFVSQPETRKLLRVLAGIYLALLLVGIGVASQPQLLPGLDRGRTQEELLAELLQLVRGRDLGAMQMSRRLKTWLQGLLIVYPLAVPPFLLVPPLLRRHEWTLVPLNKQVCLLGLLSWSALLTASMVLVAPDHLSGLFAVPPADPLEAMMLNPNLPPDLLKFERDPDERD